MVELFKKHSLIFAYILIAISIVIVLCVFKNNLYNFKVGGLSKIVEKISVNLSFDKKDKIQEDTEACFDSYCTKFIPKEHNNGYYAEFSEKYIVDDFRIKLPKSISIDEVDSIYIYSGSRNYHYNKKEIESFDKTADENYTILNIPKVDNYAGSFNHFCIMFLSLFYSAGYFIWAYVMLFLGLCILIHNKKIHLSSKYIIPIVVLGIILRINNLSYIPSWEDELYTKYVALDSFKATFSDPGNPPLFFIMEYIFTKIFSNSDFSIRFLPMMFGILTIPMIWLLFKNISKNLALFASFMASINSIMIYRSQEARAYSLDIFLVIVAVYFLFKFIENPNMKNIVINAVITALLINTNYYLIIIAGGNILWGLIFAKKNRIEYLCANFVAGISLTPYLIISFREALDSNFNSYIPKPSVEMIHSMVDFFLLNNIVAWIIVIIVTVNFIMCFVPKFKNNNKFYPYLFYIFNFTIVCATLISIYIRPIIFYGNIISIYGIFFLLIICAIYPLYNIKSNRLNILKSFITVVFSIVILNMTQPMDWNRHLNIEPYIDFVASDSQKYALKGYEIHAILSDHKEYLKEYQKLLENKDYINWHIVNLNAEKNNYHLVAKDDYTDKNSKVIVYILYYNYGYSITSGYDKLYPNITNDTAMAKLLYD